MDVRCGRCGTEYEFDDALVSERGTTVKCTNCSHQFKVHPPESRQGGPERWVVRTASGRELVYTSLRELQRGIAQRQVGPEDLLARGNQPPRPLGSIAELEPFFQGRAGSSLRKAHQARTLVGVAPPAAGSYVGPNPTAVRTTPLPPAAAAAARIPDTEAPTRTAHEMPEKRAAAGTPPKKQDIGSTQLLSEPEPPTLPRNAPPPVAEQQPVQAVAAIAGPPMVPVPPAKVTIRESMPSVDLTPTPSDVREGYRVEDAPGSLFVPSTRSVRSRWIAGLVLLGLGVLLAATVGRRYVEKFKQAAPAPAATSDDRVASFLVDAEKQLEQGDFEGARAQLDRASALSEKDPAVLAALARLEAVRTDIVWLRLRLLDPADKQLVQSTHRQLGARVGKAKEALARAVGVAPDELAVLRSRVDILRLAGELKQARELVGPLSASPTGENAYVLAALDLAEPQPPWSSVIDRLRTAASAERGLGRAHAAFIYALVRAGEIDRAKAELEKLASAADNPMYEDLSAFVARYASASADAGADAAAAVATVDPSSLPILDTSAGGEGEVPGAPGDFRVQLQQAGKAMKSGNLDKAEQLYNAVLAKEPKNTEALAGLADVARLRHDPETAAKMYDKVLKENPSYLPALMASADHKWASGDRKGALVLYKRLLEQAGTGTSYGQKAAQRIAEGESAPSGTPSGGSSPAPAPSASAAPKPPDPPPEDKPKDDPPHIDTTDLPELNK